MSEVFLFTFFHCRPFSPSVAASIPPPQNFMLFLQQKMSPFFFSPALAPFLVELRCPVALLRLSLVLCLSPSLFSKFVDMTIDLSLIV